ncbi:MAG: hypothetical protein ACI9C4_002522 [Paraglaciecola sp.]|jgi:hypothetical protein
MQLYMKKDDFVTKKQATQIGIAVQFSSQWGDV